MISPLIISTFFFFNDTATTEIYTLSLHDALPISGSSGSKRARRDETRASRIHLDRPSVVYNPWHKNRVTLYIACIRAAAGVEPDLTRLHPNAVPVVTKQSHCTYVLIWWCVAKSTT